MPDDRTPAGEDFIHDVPPDRSIPAASPERDHEKDRSAASQTLASELGSRPAIPDSGTRTAADRGERREGASGPLDGRS